MNLGVFAGGAADAYQVQERTNLMRQELDQRKAAQAAQQDLQGRQMKMAEDEAAAKSEERNRAKQLRDADAAEWKRVYGEQDVTNPDGTVTRKSFKPGEDPHGRDLDYFTSVMANRAGTMSPDELAKMSAYVEQSRNTKTGRVIEGVLAGDQASLAAFAKERGFDPASAKLVSDPKTGKFELSTDKGPIDLKSVALFMGAEKAYKTMTAQTTEAQATGKYEQGIKEGDARIGNLGAETKLRGAQAVAAGAQAGESAAGAKLKNAQADAVGDDKKDKAILAAVKPVVPADPMSADGKVPDTLAASFLQGRASEYVSSGLKPAQAAQKARAEWDKQALEIDAYRRAKEKAGVKMSMSRSEMISAALANSAPPPAAGNVGSGATGTF
jgi:hypothetical protein